MVLKVGGDLLKQLRRLVKLDEQLILLIAQVLLPCLKLSLYLFVLRLYLLAVFARRDILVLKLSVALHDLADVVDTRKELGKIVGLEDKREDVIAAVLLHRADTGTVALKLLLLECGGLLELDSLFLDHGVIELYLLFVEFYLLAGQLVALIESVLSFEYARLLLLQLVHDCLLLGTLGADGVAFLLQRLYLVRRDGVGANCMKAQNTAASASESANILFLTVFLIYSPCFQFHEVLRRSFGTSFSLPHPVPARSR